MVIWCSVGWGRVGRLSATKSVNLSICPWFRQDSQCCPNDEIYLANPKPEIPLLCHSETLDSVEGRDELWLREENHIGQRDFLGLIKVLKLMSIVSDLPSDLTQWFLQITRFQKNASSHSYICEPNKWHLNGGLAGTCLSFGKWPSITVENFFYYSPWSSLKA